MITAVDTSVLLDVFLADAKFGRRSADALRRAIGEGQLVACGPVFAEVAAQFETPAAALAALEELGVQYSEMGSAVCAAAGAAWRRYRQSGGPRRQLVADFLIAAHARKAADRLLTRDRGYSRAWFEGLQVWDPSEEE